MMPMLGWAAPSESGYAEYNHTARQCVVSGPFGDEFGSVDIGWHKSKGDLIYIQACHDWSDPACCERLCQDYNPTTNNCNASEDVLESLSDYKNSSDNTLSFLVYLSIILFVFFVTYFIIGVVAVIYFIVRG